ncbi:GNAT family N-acetyltransferase [bacterium]|nr:GNAT family N-acetyltransferase [bacterium]
MDNLEFRQIIEIDSDNLDIMTNWMYKWWGQEDGYTFDGVKCFLEHSFQKDRLPKTYGLFHNERIIGMFQFTYEDLEVRPDIYPWLANLYVDEEYRNKGVARILLEKVNEIAKTSVSFDELYLFTKHIGLYEKFGWNYISELDTHTKNPRIQRLYKLDIKNDIL